MTGALETHSLGRRSTEGLRVRLQNKAEQGGLPGGGGA